MHLFSFFFHFRLYSTSQISDIAVPRLSVLFKGQKGLYDRLITIMAISIIERHGSWYEIYDDRGKRQKTVPESIGMMLGWGSQFFIVHKGSWYDLYNEFGRKTKSIPESVGMFVSITGDTFVVRKGSWLDTYDMFGKKINSRPAR